MQNGREYGTRHDALDAAFNRSTADGPVPTHRRGEVEHTDRVVAGDRRAPHHRRVPEYTRAWPGLCHAMPGQCHAITDE
jgi:hypothetical protein